MQQNLLSRIRLGTLMQVVAFSLCTVSSYISFSSPALAQNPELPTFGDWSILCDTPPGSGKEQCAMIQSVVAENQRDVGLAVSLLRTADTQKELLRVVTSLGVWLPAGVTLKINDQDSLRAKFERCVSSGCFAEIEIQQDLRKKLEDGKTATFVIFRTPEQGIGIPVSLKGFGDAFNHLR